jgi:hypothetical protein
VDEECVNGQAMSRLREGQEIYSARLFVFLVVILLEENIINIYRFLFRYETNDLTITDRDDRIGTIFAPLSELQTN